jgi:uncharacterized protein
LVCLVVAAGWLAAACSKPPSLADDEFAVVRSGDVEAVARMLDRGARVDETGDLRITALWHAANNGDEAMVALLLDRGADARQRPVVVPPLVAAAGANSLPTVIRLLEAGADPNGEGMPSQNAIHTAAAKGNAEMVRVLIDAGANANTRFFDGTTPLLTAALAGHAEVVAALLQIDANIDAQNEREGHTALMVAAWRGHAEVVELLLAAGADRTLVDNEGRTAADLASRANPKLAERIRSYEPRND